MGFIIYCPSKHSIVQTLKTTNEITDQVWREFVNLRYPKSNNNIPNNTSSWIDQAKIYFLDATHNHWRSAGLLYYYSFLNLAKSYLVKKKSFSFRSLNAELIYHGLVDLKTQNLSDIMEYSVGISPLISSRNSSPNVFSNFYQVVTGQKWPFTDQIDIKLKDIVGYCDEISKEFEELFGVERQVIHARSLLRYENDLAWFEILIHETEASKITSQITDWNLDNIPYPDLSNTDKTAWLLSNQKTARGSRGNCILRTEKHKFTPETQATVWNNKIRKQAVKKLSKNIVLSVYDFEENEEWLFIPNLLINGKSLKWHPILSDYIVSFALSSVLRYQPQILKDGSEINFIMDGWCSQSAITTLRYFLMLFTNPPIRVIKS